MDRRAKYRIHTELLKRPTTRFGETLSKNSIKLFLRPKNVFTLYQFFVVLGKLFQMITDFLISTGESPRPLTRSKRQKLKPDDSR